MNTYHAANWSDLSDYSSEEDECRYRTTHQRTRQRGNGQQQQGDLDYITTWDKIERWSVDPGRSPPGILWNNVRRDTGEWSWHGDQGGPRGSPKNVLGGTWGVWRSQVGELRQLSVLTVEREGLGRHRVMP